MVGSKKALDNATGGIASTIAQIRNEIDVLKDKEEFEGHGNLSFLHYALRSNLFINMSEFGNKSSDITKPLRMQLGYYVQDITIPQLRISDGETLTTPVGNFQTNGWSVVPDNNMLQMTILNTKLPLIERIFYPWMREVTLPYWSYNDRPYTIANIVVDFNKHTDIKYVFTGCRPTQLQMINANQENDQSFKRQVTFTFDFMYIETDFDVRDDLKDKLIGTAGSLVGGAGKILNM